MGPMKPEIMQIKNTNSKKSVYKTVVFGVFPATKT
jgi:hypothetical protein